MVKMIAQCPIESQGEECLPADRQGASQRQLNNSNGPCYQKFPHSFSLLPFISFLRAMLKVSVGSAKVFAAVWLIFISVLFFLPGSALPKDKLFDEVYFDKWVHFGLFAVLLFLWRFYLPREVRYNWWILLLALIYGFGVEVIQHYFITNRSFDLSDVAGDMLGAIAGIWLWTKRYIKNRPL